MTQSDMQAKMAELALSSEFKVTAFKLNDQEMKILTNKTWEYFRLSNKLVEFCCIPVKRRL